MTKYNLACGKDLKAGYINIDIRPIKGVEQRDIRNVIQIVNEFGKPTELLMKDCIEHFPHEVADGILCSWLEVLEPGGKVYIQTPNIYKSAEALLEEKESIDLIRNWIYGGQGYEQNYHYTFFTVSRLKELLDEFEIDKIEKDHQIELWATKKQ